MNRAGATYSTKRTSRPRAARRAAGKKGSSSHRAVSRWTMLAVAAGMMSVLCIAVNLRAFMEMNRQSLENRKLNSEIEQLSSVNVTLQEEIKNLKGDPKTIEREARKIGMSRPNEKILVPMN